MSEQRQKGHGKKRPRKFHRGVAEGRRARAPLASIEAAEQRAVALEVETRSTGRKLLDDVDVWAGFARSAPFVPRLEAIL